MPLYGPPGKVIRDEGVNLANAPYLDFVGAGVAVATAAGVTTATIGGGISSGTSFPGSPANNDIYYRTDTDLLFFYDGTRWLTVQKYLTPFPTVLSIGNNPFDAQMTVYTALDMWMEAVITTIVLGVTNGVSDYWTMTLNKYDAASVGTSVATFNTSADTASTTVIKRTTIGAALGGSTTYKRLIHTWATGAGSPSAAGAMAELEYRLIGT